MNKPRHVNFFADDWLSGTCGLTLEERGMYITACMLIYSHGGPVERAHLRHTCPAHGRVFNRLLQRLLELGKLFEKDGLISQTRCETELSNARKRVETWLKNLANIEDKPGKSETYADRGRGAALTKEDSLEPSGSKGAEAPQHAPGMQNSEPEKDAPEPPQRDRVMELWERGVALLGKSSRSLIGKCRRDYGDLAVMEALLATEDEGASQPVEFFVGCLKQRGLHAQGRHRGAPLTNIALAAPIAVARFLERQGDSGIGVAPDVPLLGGGRGGGSSRNAARGLA